jgi:ElaB/YqjD/DUF883 family membrane-anchored ribosome-binding protein
MANTAVTEISKKTNEMRTKAEGHARAAGEDLATDLAALKAQVEDLTAKLAEAARDRAEAGARQVATVAREGYDKATETASGAYAEVERFASKRPTEALGIAAGVGLLVGLLVARR